MFRYLGEINPVGPYHFFSGIDLQHREVFNNSHITLDSENFLELGTANQVIVAYLFNGYMRSKVTFQVVYNSVKDFQVASVLG